MPAELLRRARLVSAQLVTYSIPEILGRMQHEDPERVRRAMVLFEAECAAAERQRDADSWQAFCEHRIFHPVAPEPARDSPAASEKAYARVRVFAQSPPMSLALAPVSLVEPLRRKGLKGALRIDYFRRDDHGRGFYSQRACIKTSITLDSRRLEAEASWLPASHARAKDIADLRTERRRGRIATSP